jgi:hypothetical protein
MISYCNISNNFLSNPVFLYLMEFIKLKLLLMRLVNLVNFLLLKNTQYFLLDLEFDRIKGLLEIYF